MNKQIIFKKIGYIISEITEQYQYLSENPENLNELELELFVANSHFLSEHISILNKINAQSQPPAVLNSETSSIPEETVILEIPQEAYKEEAEIVKTEESVTDWSFKLESENLQQEREEIYTEIETTEKVDFIIPSEMKDSEMELSEDQIPFIMDKTSVDAGDFSESKQDNYSDIQSSNFGNGHNREEEQALPEIVREIVIPEVADITHKVPTINDLLSGRSAQNTVSAQFRTNSINDLKSIISLNDKLLFVKDLFNGYSLAYSEAIELVNRFDNFEDADKFLQQNYAAKNGWPEKQHSVDKLYEVLNKRFS
ncbi:hypothetical protein [Daejeonella oryzae]|uniref:hypothetical protein n=1 Tax=Daejeonella oryzae TaxID=1122943 RepID=UPI00047D5789|nr:hypothetical protein [Daejeonella oryzae]